MNILVPISWLKDFLKTEASAEKIAETLSLCSQSVERIHKVDKDEILEIEITVNRYDCLSIIGIAREAAAILPQFNIKAKFALPEIPSIPKIKIQDPANQLEVRIEDQTICPRFSAIVISNVKIGPSPKWLTDRLEKVNIRSLNNVVDISNYLMMETGQPIHTFDFDKIKKQEMFMRLSKKGEKVVTLDGVERIFAGGDIVIEDGEGRIIDLCGIMGGKNSEIDEGTKKVLFFVQAYNPVRIRRTSMSLGLRTEAAMRFERGIDLDGIITVIALGTQMMKELAGGRVASKLIDIYPQKQSSAKVSLDFDFINERLGVDLKHQKILAILNSLGFAIQKQTNREFTVDVPTWRAKDIKIKEDILEEVARVYGYFRLPSKIPPISENYGLSIQPSPKKGAINPTFKWEDKTKDLLKAFGFSETYNSSFISAETISKCLLKNDDHLKLTNPINSDLEYLRISLIPSLLEVFGKNQANFSKIKIFEMANCYLPNNNDLPDERMRLVGLTNSKNFLQIKGVLTDIFEELGINNFETLPTQTENTADYWQKDKTAIIKSGDKLLGWIGQINKVVNNNFLINDNIFAFDLNMSAICSSANDNKVFTPIPKFPPIIEDLSFTFPRKTPVGQVIQSTKAVSYLISAVDLTDSFEETKTFRITFQHPDKSLTDQEVKPIREKIIKLLAKDGIKLKGQDY